MDPRLKGLKEGNKKVITELYQNQLSKVVRWVVRSGGRVEDGQDVFQDALESIIIRLHKKTLPDNFVLEAYIMQISKNKWIDQLRRKKLDDKVRLAEDKRHLLDNHFEEELIEIEKEQERHWIMKKTLSQVSPMCQMLLRLIMSGAKKEDIIKELDFSNANTMYRRKFACMKSWKLLIAKYRKDS